MANNLRAPDRRLVLFSAFAVAGCGSLGLGPANPDQTIYLLEPSLPPPDPSSVPAPFALTIDIPEALDSLDSRRIALVKADGTFDYYANASWADRLPILVQSALVTAFEGRVPKISRSQDALHADYEMSIEIRDCAAHYTTPDGAPQVTVTLFAQISTAHGRKILVDNTFTQSQMATQNSTLAVVAAYNSALSGAVSQVVSWTLSQPLTPAS